jgi:hypothetical protein
MSHSSTITLRWVLVPVAAACAWSVALVTGLLIYGGIHKLAFSFCRDKQVISDDTVCMDPWFNPLTDVAMYLGVGIAAFLILVSCVGVAPGHKRMVARVVFIAGVAVAICNGIAVGGVEGYLSIASAVGAGALTMAWLSRKHAPANAA